MQVKNQYFQYLGFSYEKIECHLKRCLQRPLYKMLKDTYDNLFDQKHKTDRQVVVLFQERMKEFRSLDIKEMNELVREALKNKNCSKYMVELIKIAVDMHYKMILLGAAVPVEMYDVEKCNSIQFFQLLFDNLGDTFFLHPFLFCKEPPAGVRLYNLKCALQLIEECIIDTIHGILPLANTLPHYLKTLDGLSVEIIAGHNEAKAEIMYKKQTVEIGQAIMGKIDNVSATIVEMASKTSSKDNIAPVQVPNLENNAMKQQEISFGDLEDKENDYGEPQGSTYQAPEEFMQMAEGMGTIPEKPRNPLNSDNLGSDGDEMDMPETDVELLNQEQGDDEDENIDGTVGKNTETDDADVYEDDEDNPSGSGLPPSLDQKMNKINIEKIPSKNAGDGEEIEVAVNMNDIELLQSNLPKELSWVPVKTE